MENSLQHGDAIAFANTPDPAHFFNGARRGALVDSIQRNLLDDDPVLCVLGEPGSGKTSICRRVAQQLATSCQIVYLAHPNLSPDAVLRAVAGELGLAAAARADKLDVLRGIQEHALAQYAQDQRVVLLVDDAQLMSDESLEELRLLINWEATDRGLIQMVLFAQPSFAGRLRSTALRTLQDRIARRLVLRRFSLWETRRYLAARLTGLASSGSFWTFTVAAAVALYCLSRGRPRRLTRLARRAWECAHRQGTTRIGTSEVVSGFLRAREFQSAKVRPPFAYAFLGSLLAAASFASGAWLPSPATEGHVSESASSSALTRAHDGQEHDSTAQLAQDFIAEQANVAAAESTVQRVTEESANSPSLTQVSPKDALHRELHAAGQAWLASADQRDYTIQLMFCWEDRSDHRTARDAMLMQARATQLADQVFLLDTVVRDRTASIVTYGQFDTKARALEAVAALPRELSAFKPFVRRIGRLQQEILRGAVRGDPSKEVAQR